MSDVERRESADRREDMRIPIEIWTEEMSGNNIIFRCTANLSCGGVFFDRAVPYEVGTRLTLRIPLPSSGGEVCASGEVVRVSADGRGMGIRFTFFDSDGRERLREMLHSTLS